MRAVVSYLASAILHAAVIGAFWHWLPSDAQWEFAVDSGQAITLSASLAAAPPESSAVAFEAIKIEIREPTTNTSEATSTAPELTKQATELPEVIEPVGEVEVEVAAVLDEQAMTRPPNNPSQPQATEAKTTSTRAAPRNQQVQPSTSTTASLAQTSVRFAGANVDRPPRMMPTNRAPDYPFAARIDRSEGRVLLLVQIDATGHVDGLSIRSSSGDSRLDDAAEEAVRFWRFYPGKQGGTPVATEVLVPVRFSLRRI